MKLSRLFAPRDDPHKWSFEELRRRCMEESAVAHREFVSRYQSMVWRTVQSHLPRVSLQDQEEVVANTFIALLSQGAAALARYVPLETFPPEAYVRRQAVLQARNRYRDLTRKKRTIEVLGSSATAPGETASTEPDGLSDPERRLIEDETLSELLVRLEQALSPQLMLTFELLYLRGLEPAEVSRLLNCSVDVIYTRKRRIIKAVEQASSARATCESAAGRAPGNSREGTRR